MLLEAQPASYRIELDRTPESQGVGLGGAVSDFVRLVGSSGCPVLLHGETGCGKTRLARLIHESSRRARMPFVRVNCGAIPESLFEREMFGHVRGAFTDARESGTGFIETAHGGTLFLDEIGELPLQVQPKLLAVLEDGAFRRLGSPRETAVDVHVIAATNRNLREMVRQKQFRQDLYYRFSVLQYRVSPLRERLEELPDLVRELLRKNAGPLQAEITPAAMNVLAAHKWPGNIRELENALRAGLVYAQGAAIEPHHLPPDVGASYESAYEDGISRRTTERYSAPRDPRREAEMIRRALEEAGGIKTVAARALGMSRSTLWAKLHRYALADSQAVSGRPESKPDE